MNPWKKTLNLPLVLTSTIVMTKKSVQPRSATTGQGQPHVLFKRIHVDYSITYRSIFYWDWGPNGPRSPVGHVYGEVSSLVM